MTQNKRIFLNIVATYGRSLYALACGLFTARWVLMALGHEDFGLYGVVGGLTVFIAFVNNVISAAVGRFYAFAIGEASADENNEHGLEECRRWFNTAVCIHTVLPLCLIVVGYPIGEWAVRHWLTIPEARVEACVWVFRFACLTCFVGMINVPFNAMYTAKQYIAELTIYGFAQTTLTFFVLLFMVTHPGAWLVRYAAIMCFVAVIPQLLICMRAFRVFPECRIRFRYMFDCGRMRQLGAFAGLQAFGAFGQLMRVQGLAILVNKYFGGVGNAAMTVASQVNGHATTLCGAMENAFTPAITTAYGAGDVERMRNMSLRACKFGTFLVLLFMIPLALELSEVMRLWLKTPPQYSIGLCWCMMVCLVLDKMTLGYHVAVHATGRIAAYQAFFGLMLLITLPLAWAFLANGFSIYSVAGAMIITTAVYSFGRMLISRKSVGMGVWRWFKEVAVPVSAVLAVSSAAGCIPGRFMGASFFRICLTTLASEAAFLPMVWFVGLDDAERKFVTNRMRNLIYYHI